MQLMWVLIVILDIIGALENKFRNNKSAIYRFGYGMLATLCCVVVDMWLVGMINLLGGVIGKQNQKGKKG